MPLCCDCCFNDQTLKEFIKEKGKKSYCDFCETEREYCIAPSELQDLFRPVVNLYAQVEELEPMKGEEIGYIEEHYEDFLWEMLQKDWKVFCSNNSEALSPSWLEATRTSPPASDMASNKPPATA